MDFAPFEMAHAPLKMTIKEARNEVNQAWTTSYSPARNAEAMNFIKDKPVEVRLSHLVARLFFRGIYFPQMSKWAWMKLIADNRTTLFALVREGAGKWRAARKKRRHAVQQTTT
jgi:hypothetical protein